jgi:hypothetical protein
MRFYCTITIFRVEEEAKQEAVHGVTFRTCVFFSCGVKCIISSLPDVCVTVPKNSARHIFVHNRLHSLLIYSAYL